MLTERQSNIFKEIVEGYINTAVPVGSKMLSSGTDLGVSSATVRNEMSVLEQAGFITCPHTSAGRIPTEHGYRYYIKNHIKKYSTGTKIKNKLKQIIGVVTKEREVKELAKEIASESNAIVIVGFNKNNFYYTGLSYVLTEPEFRETESIYSIIKVLDETEKSLADIVEEDETRIRIGSESPFGRLSSLLTTSFKTNGESSTIGILGPIRMNYNKNYNLMTYVHELFK